MRDAHLMATIHGIRSFAGVRDRATAIEIGGAPVLVASLTDIIASKRAAPGRSVL